LKAPSQFADAFADWLNITGIAARQPVNPVQDSTDGASIAKSYDPL